jgi:hypothetical protein
MKIKTNSIHSIAIPLLIGALIICAMKGFLFVLDEHSADRQRLDFFAAANTW